jgi:hypothetical protein
MALVAAVENYLTFVPALPVLMLAGIEPELPADA